MTCKRMMVSGIYVGVDMPKCWVCMTEEEYFDNDVIIWADTEYDHQIFCGVCGNKIDHIVIGMHLQLELVKEA